MSAPAPLSIEQLRRDWLAIAGPLVAGMTSPLMVTRASVLVVGVASPAFLRDLEQRSESLLASLPLVDGIRVVALRFTYIPAGAERPGSPRVCARRRRRGGVRR